MTQSTKDKIKQILEVCFAPTFLEIEDDTGRHAKHAGAQGGGGHFKVTIASVQFSGKSLLEQHRMIYDSVRTLMVSEIHALKINIKTE